MLKYYNYDIVFSEIPDEVTLAINLTNCPNTCQGCHSPWLREDCGTLLDEAVLTGLLSRYENEITCICLMGGDGAPHELARVAHWLRQRAPRLKTAWYSGREQLPEGFDAPAFDFIKLGAYIEALGGLRSRTTNQRFYRVSTTGHFTDCTARFW